MARLFMGGRSRRASTNSVDTQKVGCVDAKPELFMRFSAVKLTKGFWNLRLNAASAGSSTSPMIAAMGRVTLKAIVLDLDFSPLSIVLQAVGAPKSALLKQERK